MMVITCPFDLRLWTGVDGSAISDAKVYLRFVERRELVCELNRQLSTSAIQDCRLCIPVTQRLYEQLSNTPPWSVVRKGSHLYRLKRDVLALLRNKQGAAGLTLYVDVKEVVHLYTWKEPDGFFPSVLVAMQESWVEMVGVCAFEDAISVRGFDQHVPTLGSCVITTFADAPKARITRHSLADMPAAEETHRIPLLSQSDTWSWKQLVRSFIWDDERLPFGPIGYCPPDAWKPGERPSHYGYVDRFGGKWKWEGGRAYTERNPFEGHWNVQLETHKAQNGWRRLLELAYKKHVHWTKPRHPHVNIEVDGRITDDSSFKLT